MNCAAVSGVPSQRHRVPSQTSSTYVKANESSVAPTLFLNIDADTSGALGDLYAEDSQSYLSNAEAVSRAY
jgi:hypothetical protein